MRWQLYLGHQPKAESYQHTGATSLMRPDVGTQAQFKKKKPPKTYRYDSSLSPAGFAVLNAGAFTPLPPEGLPPALAGALLRFAPELDAATGL